MREGYETKVATLLSLGFDASVDECYNALVSSAGNMERAVEILLENQSQRGAGEDASTPLIEVEEEEEEEVKEEEEDEEEKEEEEENRKLNRRRMMRMHCLETYTNESVILFVSSFQL